MYYTNPIQLDTILRDFPARKLGDSQLQSGSNIFFEDGVVKQRYGLNTLAGIGLPLLDIDGNPQEINAIHLYKKLRDTDKYLVVCTNKDIYVYSSEAATLQLKTRNYALSTIGTSGTGARTVTLAHGQVTPTGNTTDGSKTIASVSATTGVVAGMAITGSGIPAGSYVVSTGTGTITINNECTATATGVTLTIQAQFENSAWVETNLYEISFDSADINSCTTWYQVASIDSDYQLTLAEDGVSYTAGHVYCLRLCYAGDADDVWYACFPYDNDTNERVIVCTNGVDQLQRWDATGSFTNLDGFGTYRSKFIGFWGSMGYEHVIAANIYDTGSSVSFEQTIYISDAGDIAPNGANYYELLDTNEPITGIVPLGNRLIIYKTTSISIADVNPNGGNTDAFYVQQNIIREIGTPSVRTVANIGLYHIFFSGSDIYMFDGHNCNAIGTGNIKYIMTNINKSFSHRSFAFTLPEQNLYCLAIPTGTSEYCNLIIVFNYKAQSWTFWTFNDLNNALLYPMSTGTFTRSYAPSWDDLTTAGWQADEMEHRWTDLKANENFTRIVLGDQDGYLYEYHADYYLDVDNPIISTFVTKDYDLNRQGMDFRLLELILQLQESEFAPTATIRVRASVDFGNNWTAWNTVPLDGLATYMEKKVHYNALGKQVRFEFWFNNPLVLESFRVGFAAQYKSLKFDE
jgi:hypothetical protein